MADFFASGRAADIVLAVLAIEALWLMARGRQAVEVLLALGPAMLIVLALRMALTGADWPLIALSLALAFPVHLADLKRRGLMDRK